MTVCALQTHVLQQCPVPLQVTGLAVLMIVIRSLLGSVLSFAR